KSFRNLRGVKAGFDPTGVTTVAVSLPAARYDNDQKAAAFFQQLASQIAAMPDVAEVGFVEEVPPEMSTGCTGVVTEAPTREQSKGACILTRRASPGFFEALGI